MPYLRADPQRVAAWDRLLGPRARPRIGLAWSGNAAHVNDSRRSLPLSALALLLSLDADFFSLQPEVRDSDRAALTSFPQIRPCGSLLRDFADTAALCVHLDGIVSVDTSVAHLAGALARPTHLLLPFAPDWRWLLDRSDSPWYPTFTLHRQPAPGDWESVIAETREALAPLLRNQPRSLPPPILASHRPTS